MEKFKLTYSSNSKSVIAYVDALFAPELESCRSMTGYLVQHHGNTIVWGTKKQNLVTMSSTAAEYVAIADVLPELELIRNLYKEILWITKPIDVMEDNILIKLVAEMGEQRRL